MPRAAVLTAPGARLEVTDLQLDPPRQGEICVELAASGVCHTDEAVATSDWLPATPVVLGHEGAGIVTAVGPGVTHVAGGDHVVLSAIPQCGKCFYCQRGQPALCVLTAVSFGCQMDGTTRLHANGERVYQFAAVGTFCERVVVPAVSAVRIDPAMPLELAALIGCAVVTGYAAVHRVARVRPGDTVVVLGAGGVGLSAIQGARLAGAAHIVAVDPVPWKLDLARELGATAATDLADDPTAIVHDASGGRGADVVIEASGSNDALVNGLRLTRRGGHVVVVGAAKRGSTVELAFRDLVTMHARTISGCIYGNAHIGEDFPSLVALYREGGLRLDEMVTQRIGLADINHAFDDLHHGRVARTLIVY